ncbi:hypothetical protein [Acholeplasma hippikon]|uniref:Uncharacterized protein n=1 Tax=Acholeplasma hippikon TaxID=264636 RepID=A0A449BJP6_9MOLU|nr:hypothetical protein [Acholeplasma hippikon]VEU82613.1 Uncharacterised protein [Acholeplasma hippikon]
MKTLVKHLNTFEEINLKLKNETDLNKIRFHIDTLCKYLEQNHLLDKNYVANSKIFLKAEKDLSIINELDFERLISFLTMIYRIDFVDGNADAYIIYYKNGMIHAILNRLVKILHDTL